MAPAALIAQNAGVEGEVVVEKILDSNWEIGYNAMEDKYENLFESGVIDPAKVTRCALQNAASVAGMVLTTQAIVVEKPKKKSSANSQAKGLTVWLLKYFDLANGLVERDGAPVFFFHQSPLVVEDHKFG